MLITKQISPQHGGGSYTVDIQDSRLAEIKNENKIMRRVMREARLKGWQIVGADDGGAELLKFLSMKDMLLIANNLDDVRFVFEKSGKRGWVYFVFGNGNKGFDVIADYSINCDEFMDSVNNYIEDVLI